MGGVHVVVVDPSGSDLGNKKVFRFFVETKTNDQQEERDKNILLSYS